MKPLLFLLALFALFFAAAYLQAQTTGTLCGRVTDTAGTGIPGARIEIVGTSRGAVSKPSGDFLIAGLRPGTYRVRVSSLGKTAREERVEITAGDTVLLIMALEENQYQSGETIVIRSPRIGTVAASSSGARILYSEAQGGGDGGAHSAHGRNALPYIDPNTTGSGSTFTRADLLNAYDPPNDSPTAKAGKAKEDPIYENPFRPVDNDSYSTFSIDVDNASYTLARSYLESGTLPPPTNVRVEEFINYFDYDYPAPEGANPFAFNSEVAECPWNKDHLIVRLALQGKQVPAEQLPPGNLVFLIDVSGSMQDETKLPLLRQAFTSFIRSLRPQDRVAIVVYAGAAGVVLESTSGSEKEEIAEALHKLEAGGSTAGGEGIRLAYRIARENFLPEGNNRVILATDGDFNVGASSEKELVELIEKERRDGVFLSVLGFGVRGYQDVKMEQLADNGNGNYYYLDRLSESDNVLVSKMSGTLLTIAKDVKIQVKFNPAHVTAYRLIGYENRALSAKDFDNDDKDAGDLGAGHTVTALYEVVPKGAAVGFEIDDSNEEDHRLMAERPELLSGNDLLLARLRYKEPAGRISNLIEHIVRFERKPIEEADDATRFATATAWWGMLLKGSRYAGSGTYENVLTLAQNATGEDHAGYRREFLELVRLSMNIPPPPADETAP